MKKTKRLNVAVAAWLGGVHVFALVLGALFFSWHGVVIAFVLYVITGMGVTLGYHRLLTHKSFKTYGWVRSCLAICGSLSGEGPPTVWVAFHRKHHRYSDKGGDPHSPTEGFWHAHMWWLVWNREDMQDLITKYAPDLSSECLMRLLQRYYIVWHFVLGGMLFMLGWLLENAWLGWSLVAWGIFVRMVVVLHVTWCVNSATHIWGYRNYESKDQSRNLWWVALLAFGEGWHNNHHAFPVAANHGFHRWWEWDVTYLVILCLQSVGLAWDVRRHVPT